MRKRMLGAVVGLLVVFLAVPAWTLTMGGVEVGSIDNLLFSTTALGNSGDAAELGWINNMLGTSYTTYLRQDTPEDADWTQIDGLTRVYGIKLLDTPEYFLVKTGNIGSPGTVVQAHYLFDNLASFNYAVIDLNAMGISSLTVKNIGKISHVGEPGTTQVPEPGTLLLLGTGLLGLGIVRRRRA